MKSNIERGSGFLGNLKYVFDVGEKATGDKKPEVIGSTMTGKSVQELAREFGVTRRLRPDIARPVWHCSLACPPGERPDSETWNRITRRFMEKMGFPPDTLWVAARHNDTKHDHIHIIASRISLGGEVWHGKFEAMKAIEACQELEKEFGLTLTPGLGEADAEKQAEAKLSMAEISMAERTGVQPPKLVIVNAINTVLSKGKTAVRDFIRRLRDEHDVYARPNVKSERLDGFSFEHQGVAFSGSQLAKNKALTWKNLQKKGVDYEPTRDSEEVTNALRIAAERAAGREDAERDSSPPGAGEDRYVQPTPGSGEGVLSVDTPSGDPGQEPASPAHDTGHAGGRDSHPGDGRINEDDRGQHGHSGRSEGPKKRPTYTGPGSNGSERDQENKEGSDMENHTTDGGQRPAIKRPGAGSSWNARFKKASAAKRADQPANGAGRRVAEPEIITAQQVDPSPMLESAGYVVKRQGKHMSICHPAGDEVYRITLMPDGRYVACDHYGNGVGDNIALVRDLEPGLSFPDAVYKLTGGQSLTDAVVHAEPPPIAPPRLPRAKAADIEAGREYLRGRAIDDKTLQAAEEAGFLRYVQGGVIYAGLDKEGKVKAATRRATDPTHPVQKRDFKGTNKYFAAVLPGSPERVFIVEGGADALALHSMAHRANREPPTVIVSSGSNVLSFLRNQETQALLKRAQEVTIMTEVEKDTDTQAKVEKARQKQIEAIQAITGKPPTVKAPEHGAKDVSEQNAIEVGKAKADNSEDDGTTTPTPEPRQSSSFTFKRPKG